METSLRSVLLVGYSGHALVVGEALIASGRTLRGYFEAERKGSNPLGLDYLGSETEDGSKRLLSRYDFFVAIGDNKIREKLHESLSERFGEPTLAIHPGASISESARLDSGVFVAARAVVNSGAHLEKGAICNSGAIVEHHCRVGSFAHIASGAVLAGGVSVGPRTLIGAGAVLRPGLTVCQDVLVGVGAVVVKDILESGIYVGCPARRLHLGSSGYGDSRHRGASP